MSDALVLDDALVFGSPMLHSRTCFICGPCDAVFARIGLGLAKRTAKGKVAGGESPHDR